MRIQAHHTNFLIMKFTCTVTINKPLDQVAAFFADPQYLGEYQEGFVKKELLSGEAGQDGAVSLMFYDAGGRKMELTETIISNRLPEAFEANYHHIHMDNSMNSYFTALAPDQTRYDAEIEYTAFRGFMVKIMAFIFPGMFKKQVQKWLNNFKTFVERN